MKAMLRFFALCVIVSIVAAATTFALHIFHFGVVSGDTDVKYTDFLSLTLTALSLMITILGFFVAAAGVIGWTTLEGKLRSHSIEYFAKQLEKDAPLRKEFENLFANIATTGIEGLKTPKGEDVTYND